MGHIYTGHRGARVPQHTFYVPSAPHFVKPNTTQQDVAITANVSLANSGISYLAPHKAH